MIRLADQITDRARTPCRTVTRPFAEIQQAVGRAAIAHLVVQPGEHDVVVLAVRIAIGARQELRHDEQRDAARAGLQPTMFVGNLREHEVDDVLRQLVLAAGYPHLVAGQPVARAERRIAFEIGARRDVGQRRAGLRLRQAHRAEETPFQLGARERIDLRGAAVRDEQVRIGDGQERIRGRRDVRGLEEQERRGFDQLRQAHAAERFVVPCGDQPGVRERAHGRFDFRDQRHAFAVEPRLVAIAARRMRREQVFGDPFAGVEHRVEGLATMLRVTRQRDERFGVEPVVQQEREIASRHQQAHRAASRGAGRVSRMKGCVAPSAGRNLARSFENDNDEHASPRSRDRADRAGAAARARRAPRRPSRA